MSGENITQEQGGRVENKDSEEKALHVELGTLGYYAETSYSGNDYFKWVSEDGALVIGNLPDLDDMPNLGEVGSHDADGRKWIPISLGQFARLERD